MSTHDRYEQDILRALKGIDNSLKRIADALAPVNEKKTINKRKTYYYELPCPFCGEIIKFDGYYPFVDPESYTLHITCPKCDHVIQLPERWEEMYKVNEQNNEN